MSEKKILHTLEEGILLTGLVAGIGWVGQKAFGESLSPNPGRSLIGFIKMSANVTGSMFLRDWLKKEKYWPDILMATAVAMMVGGAILNATALTGSSYLAKYLSGDSSAAILAERARHDKALEAYQREMGAWQKKREEYRDWLNQRYREKMKADKDFENTDLAFKLYAATHPDPQEINYLRRKPVFKYTPSDRHKNNELLYVGLGGLAIGAAVGYFI